MPTYIFALFELKEIAHENLKKEAHVHKINI